MKYNELLKKELIYLGEVYGKNNFGNAYAQPNEPRNSSLIFGKVNYSFQRDSWSVIEKDDKYSERIRKIHPNVQTKDASILEMQSSNSSDALAMNIFCHPKIKKWKGISNLFEVENISTIEFGFEAKVLKKNQKQVTEDKTEVDVLLNNSIIIECKLTENDFVLREKFIVESYNDFKNIFHKDKLPQTETHYDNYQLIRNILAANQYNARFILICDMRRPDLARHFYQTIRCIKDEYLELRTNCEIIYWQDVAQVVGLDLQIFLKDKYGIY